MGKVIMSGIVPKLTKPIGLPTGYTRLEYIESTGTQYIDTGFIPNQDTRIDIVATPTSVAEAADGSGFIPYGAGEGHNSRAFECYTATGQYEFNYAGQYQFCGSPVVNKKVTISHNKGEVSLSVEGELTYSLSFTYATFTAPYSMILFGIHRSNVLRGLMKLYSCQIYDNGTLIRDFIPCMSNTGVIGLYDSVGKKFYENKGSGNFTANIVQPIEGILASNISVGSSVYLMENGNAAEYLVVNHGKPSSSTLYDDSCEGIWLMRKDLYEKRAWGYTDYNAYNSSTIHSYLNGEFLSVFDADFQAAIKQVKIPYYNGSSVEYNNNGLSTKVFLPAMYELGFVLNVDGSLSTQFAVDGAKLSYFLSGTTSSAYARRKANYNGSADYWWSRSGNTAGGNTSVSYITIDGTLSNSGAGWASGIRPTLVIPYNSVFDEETLLFKGVS